MTKAELVSVVEAIERVDKSLSAASVGGDGLKKRGRKIIQGKGQVDVATPSLGINEPGSKFFLHIGKLKKNFLSVKYKSSGNMKLPLQNISVHLSCIRH
jgi:hypothetical protein